MLKEDITQELDDDFQAFISHIFEANSDFIQTDDAKICGFCPYNNICSKT